MSDTTETVERPYQPTHVLSSDDPAPDTDRQVRRLEQTPEPPAPSEPPPATAPAPEPQPAAEDGAGDDATPTPEQAEEKRQTDARRAEQKRIDHLTRQRYAEKARADRAEADRAQLEERLRRLENPGQARQPDIDALVNQRVQAEMQAAETKRQVESFHTAGQTAFPDWGERCQNLMEMGADKQIAEMLVQLANGPAVAAALADDPAELQRIADLKSERARAIELGKYSGRIAAQGTALASAPPSARAPAAPLPAPIRPPSGGRARGEPDPNGSMDDYMRWSQKVAWNRT